MTKKIILVTAIIMFAVVLTGCENQGLNENSQVQGQRNLGKPDFGQPQEQADISGFVSDIIGNEVTILLMERRNMEKGKNGLESNQDENNVDADSKQTMKLSLGGSTEQGGMRGNIGGGRKPEGNGEIDKTAMLERMKEMSTGSEKIIIPVGIQMLKISSDNKQETVEAMLADVKTDSMLQIWLNEKVPDKKVASFVLISS